MSRKSEAGQALVLALIILAIGALLVIPTLRLTRTSLDSSEIVTQKARLLYAADAAQEYVMWKLLYDNSWRTEYLGSDGDTGYLNCDVCGVLVNMTIVMRATEGKGGVTLAGDDVIRPTKSVSPNATDGSYQTYTYIIKLEQLSENNSQGLDVIYDILPNEFDASDYVDDSSRLRVDGGPWQDIVGNPLIEYLGYGGQVRLRWPNPNTYGSENFTSPVRDFAIRQVKELRFEITGTLLDNRTYYNWVVLKTGDTTTLSGTTAPIITGNGDTPEGGLLQVSKTSYPAVILPGVETDIEYTIYITNLDGSVHQIQEITDYLPPGFVYLGPTSNITDSHPQGWDDGWEDPEDRNGVLRHVLRWTTSEFPNGNAVSIASGETLALTFWATATKDVSGSYYNEVTVVPNTLIPKIFEDIGVTYENFNTGYSWTTGAVIVPAYDSSANATGLVIDANLALAVDSISITSYQIK